MSESKVYRGGMPYGPDIKRLREAYPSNTLTEGLVMEHAALEGIIGAPKGSQRYYGVINSWRSEELNKNGIFMAWQPGDGLKVLSPSEILARGDSVTLQKIKQLGRATKIYAWVSRDRLDEMGQKRLDHQLLKTGQIREAMNTARREMAIDLAPIKSLPRPMPIKSKSG